MSYQLVFIVFLFTSYLGAIEPSNKLEEANRSYQQGVIASTLLERKNAFNQALSLYLELENERGPINDSAKLYEAIANSYFQLGEYAWSILYNYKALKLEPYNNYIREHLQLAQTKLGLSPQIEKTKLNQILSFNQYFSLSQRLELFFWLTLITICSYSLLIYFPFIWVKKIASLLLIIVCLLFMNLTISFYFSPIEAILIEPTGLYREPFSQQIQLLDIPLLKGIKVHILDITQEGYWLKVETPDGVIGYIPAKFARII